MNLDVSEIVREVIAELERRRRNGAQTLSDSPPPAAAPAPPLAPPAAAASSAPPTGDAREMVVCSRVVSLEQIRDRLPHIRRLVVSSGAILTPAVRDALADRNITVAFGESGGSDAGSGARGATAAKLVLVTARTKYDPASLVAALRAEGVGVESQTSNCLIRTVDMLAGRVGEGTTLAAVLTHDVAAAVCLANRMPGVRAVSGGDPAGVVEAAKAVGANVLVADPRGRGVFQLKQLLSAFCRGPWACPEVLRPRLG